MADLLFSDRGPGAELREILEEALGIPPNARAFSVTFADGEPITVSCDYRPVARNESEDSTGTRIASLPRLGASLDD